MQDGKRQQVWARAGGKSVWAWMVLKLRIVVCKTAARLVAVVCWVGRGWVGGHWVAHLLRSVGIKRLRAATACFGSWVLLSTTPTVAASASLLPAGGVQLTALCFLEG